MEKPVSDRLGDLRDAFARDGYYVFDRLIPGEKCDALKKRMAVILEDFDPALVPKVVFSTGEPDRHAADRYFLESGDKIRFFFEKDAFDEKGNLRVDKAKAINKVGHALHDLDPEFDAFSRQDCLRDIALALGFKTPLLLQSMYIFKQPYIGGEVGWHQDATFLYTEPMSVVGFWFALEDATATNGALMVEPGGHHSPLRDRFRRKGDKAVTEKLSDMPWPDTANAKILEVAKGSLVLLHAKLPHASMPNHSPVSRHAFTLHLIDGATHYPDDNWLRRDADFPLQGF